MGVQLSTGKDKGVKPNINVTPLVDVVLVLLIIFMLVIPNMQEGVPIELFKAKNAEKDSEEAEPITLSIAKLKDSDEVSYHIGDVEFSRDQLIAELARQHQADPSKPLLFRGDSRIDYGKIRDVFHECQNLGFAYIQLAVGAQKEGWE
ncbi:MAG TPA: biopolymer transporter ExbD [Enhygromyxa sp.]|nr:biopolymer transporter ExbD [Enhygromyxa sp.]